MNEEDGTYAIDCWQVGEHTARDPHRIFFGEEADIACLLLEAHRGLQRCEYGRVVLCKKEPASAPDGWMRLTELRSAV